MESDDALFEGTGGRQSRGRVRRGLDDELRARRDAGHAPAADQVALLRTLADAIDRWSRFLETSPEARAYDRISLAQLAAQYDATRAVALPERMTDAVDDLLSRLYAEESDAAEPGPRD